MSGDFSVALFSGCFHDVGHGKSQGKTHGMPKFGPEEKKLVRSGCHVAKNKNDTKTKNR